MVARYKSRQKILHSPLAQPNVQKLMHVPVGAHFELLAMAPANLTPQPNLNRRTEHAHSDRCLRRTAAPYRGW